MCNYQTLFADDALGWVVRCGQCATIQFAFGNIGITFLRPDFYRVLKSIKKIGAGHQATQLPGAKSIIVPAPCEGLHILLTPVELKNLDRMLDEAETELRSLELLNLF